MDWNTNRGKYKRKAAIERGGTASWRSQVFEATDNARGSTCYISATKVVTRPDRADRGKARAIIQIERSNDHWSRIFETIDQMRITLRYL